MILLPNLLETIKAAAVEAMVAAEPTGILFGTVSTTAPLTVFVDQKLTLTREFLVLTRNVMDIKVERIENNNTEGVASSDTEGGFIIYNGLKKGDGVILLKQQGGQKYIILDKTEVGK